MVCVATFTPSWMFDGNKPGDRPRWCQGPGVGFFTIKRRYRLPSPRYTKADDFIWRNHTVCRDMRLESAAAAALKKMATEPDETIKLLMWSKEKLFLSFP